jgi:hypothetical protein
VIRPSGVAGIDLVPGSRHAARSNVPMPHEVDWPAQVSLREFLSGVRDRTGAVQEVVRQVGCVHRLSSARRVQVHGSQPDVSAGGAGAAYITSAVTREKPYR